MTADDMAAQGGALVAHVDADIAELIPSFLENRCQDVAAIPSALERGDYDAVRAIGHDMKGTGAGYGFDAITDLGARLEQAAKDGHYQEIRRLRDELATYLERVEVIYE